MAYLKAAVKAELQERRDRLLDAHYAAAGGDNLKKLLKQIDRDLKR